MNLSRREVLFLVGLLAIILSGNIVRSCRRPQVEFVPTNIQAAGKTLQPAAEPAPATDPD
jgi:hypothetical protein